MRTIVGLLVAIVAASASPARADATRDGVVAALTSSAAAWNRGDLDAFMKTYEDSPQTMYIGATVVIRGYAAIRAHYAGSYKPGRMGTLSFTDLTVRLLGADYAVATARYHVARPAASGGNATGLFSLVLHRHADGWQIITDHTP